MLREALDQSANYHDRGSSENRPSSTEAIVDDGDERQREDGS